MIDFPKNFKDPDGDSYSLSRATWAHIATGHGELIGKIKEIKETVESPDTIIQSDHQKTRYLYKRKTLDLDYIYCVVVVDRSSKSIVTAYLTNNQNI